jgi:hypothetical protein
LPDGIVAGGVIQENELDGIPLSQLSQHRTDSLKEEGYDALLIVDGA